MCLICFCSFWLVRRFFSTDPIVAKWDEVNVDAAALIPPPPFANVLRCLRGLFAPQRAWVGMQDLLPDSERPLLYAILAGYCMAKAISSERKAVVEQRHVHVAVILLASTEPWPVGPVCKPLPFEAERVWGWRGYEKGKSRGEVSGPCWGPCAPATLAKTLAYTRADGAQPVRRLALGDFGDLHAHPGFLQVYRRVSTLVAPRPPRPEA
jgi:hypothetical protein